MDAPRLPRSLWPELLIVAFAAVLIFGRVHLPLLEPEEARYAEIPRQMLHHGSAVVPWRNGQAYLDKPPLLYWLVIGSYTVFGVHDWAGRLVSALAAFLTVPAVYAWGRLAAGRTSGLAAAGLLVLAGDFVYRGPMLTMNGLLGLFVTIALAAGYAALLGGRLRAIWWAVSAIACGLGVLTKGPVAGVLVVPCLFALRWVDRSTSRPGWQAWAGYAGVIGGVAGPWFVAAAVAYPEFIEYFFWKHHVERYVQPFDHAKPWWAYLPQVAVGLAPCLVVLAVRTVRTRFNLPAAAVFAVLAAGWGLLFFSVAGSKRPIYLLPVEPSLAVGAGIALASVERIGRGWQWAGGLTAVGMAAGVFAWLPQYSDQFSTAAVVQTLSADGHEPAMPVVSCGYDWDSVGFYLDHDGVESISSHDPAELVRRLDGAERTVVFVRNDAAGRALLAAIPARWHWHQTGENRQLLGGVFTH